MEEYLIPAAHAEAELIEKKSRFIGAVYPVESEQEARALLEAVKREHYDARHNCWCYILRGGAKRYSDDGEPQGTAGQPMLAVFDRENVQNVVCIVTRYFGGILLGAGGLTRAYAKAAKMALDAAGIARRCVWDCVDISCSYAFLERARLELAAQDGEELSTEFAADVLLHGCIPQAKLEALTVRLRELSAGTVLPKKTGSIYRAEKVKK